MSRTWNVKILPFAEKFPPLLIVKAEVGEKVTSLKRLIFPFVVIIIFAPVYVPEPDTAEVESKLKLGNVIEPSFVIAEP